MSIFGMPLNPGDTPTKWERFAFLITVEPLYNEVLGTMNIT